MLREIVQAGGGEQGDPLMPLLFCLGVHDALDAVHSQLGEDEHLFAFLDDTYVVTFPQKARTRFDNLSENLGSKAGTQLHLGNLNAWLSLDQTS